MTRKDAYYERIMLLCCYWDNYDEWLDSFLETEDSLSNIVPDFLDIVAKDKRYKKDANLVALAALIDEAIKEQKYVIHYGV